MRPLDESDAATGPGSGVGPIFIGTLRAAHATATATRTGGFPLLATQMMEAVSYRLHSAPCHLAAGCAAAVDAAVGDATVPALTATFECVPLEFFEARTGELRFLGLDLGDQRRAARAGAVDDHERAGSHAGGFHFNTITSDSRSMTSMNFSEKFGTPGLVVHTTAGKDSPEGQDGGEPGAWVGQGNYRGVQYGAEVNNRIEIVWPSGGSVSANLPMTAIIEDCKRGFGDAVSRRGFVHPVARGSGGGRECPGRGPGRGVNGVTARGCRRH